MKTKIKELFRIANEQVRAERSISYLLPKTYKVKLTKGRLTFYSV